MKRVAEAETRWRHFSKGTPIEALYGSAYAGLFRNPQLTSGGAERLYGRHLYPVIAAGHCRHNVTGLTSREETARLHVAAFVEECYE